MVFVLKPTVAFIAVHLLITPTVLQRFDYLVLIPVRTVPHLNTITHTSYLNRVGSLR